ncbi:uncharacterized protein METZ01_LOCUS513731, partial [marine metagenome]
ITVETIFSPIANDVDGIIWSLIKSGKFYKNFCDINSQKKKMIWQSLNQFRKVVFNYCINYDANDLKQFIDFIDVQCEVNEELLEPLHELSQIPAVRVMTVHSAKGMEFKHVFMPFLRTGSFPLNYRRMSFVDRLPISWQRWEVGNSEEKELHYEEERRLFYVAVTRAMDTLTLFAPEKSQSLFVRNIRNELLEKEKIIKKTKNLSSLDKLTGNYIGRIQSEISLGHYNI